MLEGLPDEPPDGFDRGGPLARIQRAANSRAEEERALFEAAARDQDLFDQLMEAETIRHALEHSRRAPAGRRGLAGMGRAGCSAGNVEPVPIRQAATLRPVPPRWPGSGTRRLRAG